MTDRVAEAREALREFDKTCAPHESNLALYRTLEAILAILAESESRTTEPVAEGVAVEQWEHHWSSDAADAYCIHCSANRASRYGKCLSFELHEWEAYGLDEMMCRRCGRIIYGNKPRPVKFHCIPVEPVHQEPAAGEASDEELARVWDKALHSGEFPQLRGYEVPRRAVYEYGRDVERKRQAYRDAHPMAPLSQSAGAKCPSCGTEKLGAAHMVPMCTHPFHFKGTGRSPEGTPQEKR